jgi:hypothetical protein
MVLPHFFNPVMFISELVFTILAVIFCLLIFIKTKESYELTKHKGIKYFRLAFLFFGLSYILRFLLSLVMLSRFAFEIAIPRELFMLFSIVLLGYFSTMGILYLIFGAIWKHFNQARMLVFGHTIALLLSLVCFVTRSPMALLLLQCVLLVIAVILRFVITKKESKLSQTKVLYILISLFWLINLLVIDSRRHLPLPLEVFFYVVSLVVFVMIYLKVSKWVQ